MLSVNMFCVWSMQLRRYVYGIPIFPNLTHMELVFDSKSWEHQKWKWINQLLQNCPMLQNLTISEVIHICILMLIP